MKSASSAVSGVARHRGALMAAALLSLTLSAAPAHAAVAPPSAVAATCVIQEGLDLRDTIGNVFTKALNCDNLPSEVFGRPAFDAPITGWLKLSPSRFTCFTKGPADTTGNTYWYYVQGDQVGELPPIKGWGNVPGEVLQLSGGLTHPVAGLPRCPWF
ncbi:hypothetical protein [Streptomyces jumonjinensis]|uniref:Uncharacterized protein n=1 Tax=Streptomyces jumonjinensis TaxID=1945 RepID=A0A646KTM0_STRJU|nr:hypothetical protein [Streptomyces jumonjinensis]MQT05583.1 hypothetical protein [Streptomyces jumonjinensis]